MGLQKLRGFVIANFGVSGQIGFMIWDIYQQQQITAAGHTAERAERKAEGYATDIDGAKQHMERLSLACQAMWELLRENSNLTEEDLENKIIEVDLRDGVADGKMRTQVLLCANCGKNTNSKRSTCVMCGAPFRRPHQFEA